MLYKLYLANYDNGEKKIFQYDTILNHIYDENNEIVIVKNYFEKREENKRMTIQLGFSCNMSCSYCLQSKTKKSHFDKDKCVEILKKLSYLDLSDTRLEFWGGEPLLYLKEIIYITRHLKNYYKKSNKIKFIPKKFLIITNGILLNKRIVKFFIKHNFSFILSHDATGQNIRGKDPLDNPVSLEAIKYLIDNHSENFSINSVITETNIDTNSRIKFFSSKLNRPKNIIINSGEGPVYNTYLPLLNKNILGIKILNDIMYGDGLIYNYYLKNISSFLKKINTTTIDDVSTKCGIENKDNYNILDLHNKELSCHNFDYKFTILKPQDNKKCRECLVLHLCKGGCPAINKDSELFSNNCGIMFETNYAFLKFIIYHLTDNKFQLYDFEKIG